MSFFKSHELLSYALRGPELAVEQLVL